MTDSPQSSNRTSVAVLGTGSMGAPIARNLLGAGFAVSGLAWVAFAGLVSYRIISSLTDLEYWAVASRIYDVRQAKRLFGLIGFFGCPRWYSTRIAFCWPDFRTISRSHKL